MHRRFGHLIRAAFLLAALALPAIAASSRPAGTPVAQFPAPHPDQAWLSHFAENQSREKQGPYDLVLDGASIMERWQTVGHDVWNRHFSRFRMLDNGISGDQVQNALWRVQHGDLDGLDPKLILLQVGTNNAGQNPKDVARGIKLLIGEYEKRTHAHILLMGLFPRDPSPASPARTYAKAVNAALASYRSDPRVTYMDIYAKFLQPDGTLTSEMMPDFLHPSAKGYEIWASAIQPVIEKYVPNAASVVK